MHATSYFILFRCLNFDVLKSSGSREIRNKKVSTYHFDRYRSNCLRHIYQYAASVFVFEHGLFSILVTNVSFVFSNWNKHDVQRLKCIGLSKTAKQW